MVAARRDAGGGDGSPRRLSEAGARRSDRLLSLALGGSLLATGLALGCAGCLLDRSGALSQDCTADSQCDDGNGCTRDACGSDGTCQHSAFDGGAYLLQVPGDCQLLGCVDGLPVATADDTDVPANPCIDATCFGGQLNQHSKPEGAPCQLGSGTGSCTNGQCVVQCDAQNAAEVCNDQNSCTTDGCDITNARCLHQPLDGQPAPGVGQLVGDCQVVLCVAGTQQTVADDADVKDDGNECTIESCANGQLTTTNAPQDSPCGTGLVCDDAGVCVGCNSPDQCGWATDCMYPTCSSQQCGVVYVASGTPLPDWEQDAWPCRNKVCDGWGSVQYVPRNSNCDDGLFCNGTSDQCIGGNCGGVGNYPCPGANGDSNCNESCDETSHSCDAYDGDGTACVSDSFCAGGVGQCQNGACAAYAPADPCPGADNDPDCNESCEESTKSCTAYDGDWASCLSAGVNCAGSGPGHCTSGGCEPDSPTNGCNGPDGDSDCYESCDANSQSCTGYDGDGAACVDESFCTGGPGHCTASGCVADNLVDPCPVPSVDPGCSSACNEQGHNCQGRDPVCTPCGTSGGSGGGDGGVATELFCDSNGTCSSSQQCP